MSEQNSPRSILLMAHCLLGDSLVMIPALQALRKRFPEARIGLVSERHRGRARVRAADVLAGRGLVDEFHEMTVGTVFAGKLWNRVCLLSRLRLRRWDLGIVLVPPHPPATDSLFHVFGRYLTRFGARQLVLPGAVPEVRRNHDGHSLPTPHVADLLLGVLEPLGISVPSGQGQYELPPLPCGSPIGAFPPDVLPVAVAPATNMPCKCWPLERYADVLRKLAGSVPIHPVFFGGEGDRNACNELLHSLPVDGTLVVGQSIAEATAIMRQCVMYLGNDTGVMHLAAATGKPCVAVFSARDVPEAWYPYGPGHHVFRTPLPCDACFGQTCPRGTNECVLSIQVDDVLRACLDVLARIAQTGRSRDCQNRKTQI